MLNIFAKSIMTATRNPEPQPSSYRAPLDSRKDAECDAHSATRRRD